MDLRQSLTCSPQDQSWLEFVRKVSSDDYIIITNRLRSYFHLLFYRENDPSTLETFRIPTQVGKLTITYLKNGTLIVRGDDKTREFQHVVDTIRNVMEYDLS